MSDFQFAGNGSSRLQIRLLERRDLEDVRLLHNADETLQWLTDIQHVSEPQQAHWFELVSGTHKSRRYVARDRDSNALIGVFRIDAIDLINRNCQVGCDIIPGQRRKGFASEFFSYILNYLFDQIGIHHVELTTRADNAAAIGLYSKLGFVEEGLRREALYRNGGYVDLLAMGLLDREWRAVRERQPF